MQKTVGVLAATLATGCATTHYDWVKSEREPLPMKVVVVGTYDELKSACALAPIPAWAQYEACAVYYPRQNECRVFTQHDPMPDWLREHEEKHCNGWDHR